MKERTREYAVDVAENNAIENNELTKVEIKGLIALADEIFNKIYDEYMKADDLGTLDRHFAAISHFAETEPVFAVDIIKYILIECKMDNLLDELLAFAMCDGKHIEEFAKRFSYVEIMKALADEAEALYED